jgi:protein ImuB
VWLPHLSADRILRARLRRLGAKASDKAASKSERSAIIEPAPLVIVENVKGAMRIVAVSRKAKAAGVIVGGALADARAIFPVLDAVEADAFADASLLEAIAEDCDRFTPVVMIDAPDGVLLDITGCAHLFGDDVIEQEDRLRRALGRRLARAGLTARMVIAGAPDTARALARFGRTGIVPAGGEAAAVRPLPVAALGLAEDARLALTRAGLKTIGHLADLPTLPLVARFTADITRRLDNVCGCAIAPLKPHRAIPVCMAERRFAEPIARAEDIKATLADLTAQAADTLGQRREGGRVFEASFFRSDGAVRRIAVESGRATRDAAVVMRLFRERLDALADPIDPGFGFDLVRLCIAVSEPMDTAQTSLDGHVAAEGEIADLVSRLAARFGREQVVCFQPVDSHAPERGARIVPAVEARNGEGGKGAWAEPEDGEPPLRPLRLFDPPQPVDVVADVPDGPPARFTWRRIEHNVASAEGPERIAPEWWRRPGAVARDYYRIEDASGCRVWLYREGQYGDPVEPRWYIHGMFA